MQTEAWITHLRKDDLRNGPKVRIYRFLDDTEHTIFLDILGPKGGIYAGLDLTPAQARQIAKDLMAAAKRQKG